MPFFKNEEDFFFRLRASKIRQREIQTKFRTNFTRISENVMKIVRKTKILEKPLRNFEAISKNFDKIFKGINSTFQKMKFSKIIKKLKINSGISLKTIISKILTKF